MTMQLTKQTHVACIHTARGTRTCVSQGRAYLQGAVTVFGNCVDLYPVNSRRRLPRYSFISILVLRHHCRPVLESKLFWEDLHVNGDKSIEGQLKKNRFGQQSLLCQS